MNITKQNKVIYNLENKAEVLGEMLFEARHEEVKESIRKKLIGVQNRIFTLYQIIPLK